MPDTRTIEIWADSRSVTTCRGERCGRAIEWARVVASGARMCFDAPIEVIERKTVYPAPGAKGVIVEVVDLTRNHWATCIDKAAFQRRRPARG